MRRIKTRVREARFFEKETQLDLSLKTGIDHATISRIERGYQIPSETQKRKLANALNRDIDWLFPKKRLDSKNFSSK